MCVAKCLSISTQSLKDSDVSDFYSNMGFGEDLHDARRCLQVGVPADTREHSLCWIPSPIVPRCGSVGASGLTRSNLERRPTGISRPTRTSPMRGTGEH